MDETVLSAFGFERPPQILCWVVDNTLKFRSRLLRLFPPLEHPQFPIDSPIRSYPTGYKISELGPPEKSNAVTRQQEIE